MDPFLTKEEKLLIILDSSLSWIPEFYVYMFTFIFWNLVLQLIYVPWSLDNIHIRDAVKFSNSGGQAVMWWA